MKRAEAGLNVVPGHYHVVTRRTSNEAAEPVDALFTDKLLRNALGRRSRLSANS